MKTLERQLAMIVASMVYGEVVKAEYQGVRPEEVVRTVCRRGYSQCLVSEALTNLIERGKVDIGVDSRLRSN